MPQLDELLEYTKERGASDLHLVAGLEPRIRLYGKLRAITDWPPMSHKVLLEVFKEICPPDRWAHFIKRREINRAYTKHIVTIEDPLEFIHQSKSSIISHREVGMQSSSFSNALRSAIRQDADVILVGEMRDAALVTASELKVGSAAVNGGLL